VFLALKTTGEVRARAAAIAWPLGAASIVLGATFLAWTQTAYGSGWTWAPALLAAAALVGGVAAARAGREGLAFTGTAVAIVAVTVTLFGSLYPDVLPASNEPANSLTTTNAASTPYTLEIMTWVAVIFTPIVLA
jgi:cytochrome d ubiquinol oxidase subunit II